MIIPDHTVEEVRAASDLIEVVGDYVRLKRRGSNYFGLCPFHSENTPSFSVNPALGIYKCFGCGAGGDVFNFITSVEGITFPDAVRMLAAKAGIDIAENDGERERLGETEAVYNALQFAARHYFAGLTRSKEGERALDYLVGRGLTKATIRAFGLGYASDRWDGLLVAARENHVSEAALEEAGLIIPRKESSGYYDRFRDRIIFPIFSHVGKVLGFGGRILSDDSDQPKYINSPETRVYNKSRVLYGLSLAKQAIRKREEALLVEGYTDVIALHQAGITYAVASSGTSLTREQVKLLSRYARRIVLLFDADAAGAGAALRGIDLILDEGLAVYAVELPAGDDPDSFARNEKGSVESYLNEHRRDFATYIVDRARAEGRFETPEGEAGVMHDVVNAIARIPDPLIRETYLKRAADVLSVPDIRLYEALERVVATKGNKSGSSRRRKQAETSDPQRAGGNGVRQIATRPKEAAQPLPEEKSLIRMMLEYGSPMVEFILGNMSLDEFTPGAARECVSNLLHQYEDGLVERQAFLNGTFGPEVQRLTAEVSVELHEPSENWERKQKITVPKLDGDPYQAAVSAMMLLKLDRVKAAIDKHKEEMYRASRSGGELQPLQQQMMALHELRRRIERKEFLQE